MNGPRKKEKISKRDLVKIQNFCISDSGSKDTVKKETGPARDQEKIFAEHRSHEGLAFKLYKQLL